MKAAIFYEPGKMCIEDVKKPEAKEGEILIKVSSCAICGTDLRIYDYGHHNVKPPQTIGHEIAGTIEEIGKGVNGYEKGDKVIIVTEVGCGNCNFCLRGIQNLCKSFTAIGYHWAGGFAQYFLMPARGVTQGNVLKFPKHLSFEEASLAEPLSCVINGQSFLHIGLGETVVVIGSGPIGCMHVELAKISGAGKVILADISTDRLKLGKMVSTDVIIDSSKEDLVERVMQETNKEGADVVIVACSSGKAQEDSLKLISTRGRISFFGGLPKDKPTINFNSNIVHYKEISVYGAFASYPYQYKQALDLISSKRIDASKFITHRFKLDEIVKAIEAAKSGKTLKVVINP